jgi:hypothetical protein
MEQILSDEIYTVAKKFFNELMERPYFQTHRTEAIDKAARNAGTDFETFQSEMTRRRSLYKKNKEKQSSVPKVAKPILLKKKVPETGYLFWDGEIRLRDPND